MLIARYACAGQFAWMLQRAETAATLAGVNACRIFFEDSFSNAGAETLLVAHIDNGARCIHLARYEGDSSGVTVPIGQIIADATHLGSAGLVLAHNHPSGDPSPSRSDTQVTRRLATAAEALDVSVLDHLIFAGQQCTSMRRSGLL